MSKRELIIFGCSSQQPTRLRNHGAYLLRWHGEGLLFDPGEGTQRQFIFANVAPPVVNKIFVSHFHGDHCLGLGSMLMRLNLDKVTHPIHCYYPASGKVYFDRLRYCSAYREKITIVEHPIKNEGLVEVGENFSIEARFLDHAIDNIGWRIIEHDARKFNREKLQQHGIRGPLVGELEKKGELTVDGKVVSIESVSEIKKGAVFSVAIDTRPCKGASLLAKNSDCFLCESTYLEEHRALAHSYHHMTAKQAALIAKEASAKKLILTHFSARYRDLEEFAEEAKEIFPNVEIADDLKRFTF